MAGQEYSTNALGGFTSIGRLSKKFRHVAQPMISLRKFTRPLDNAQGKNKGDTIKFDRVKNVDTAGGSLAETQPIPITQAQMNQGTLTLTEYGLGVGWTGKLEALSEMNIENDMVVVVLKNDAAKTLNTEIDKKFGGTGTDQKVKYIPTGTDAVPAGTFDEDGTVSTLATRDIQAFDVYEIIERLKGTYFAPPWDGMNYVCVASAAFLRKLREDADFEDAMKYADPQKLLSGEVTRFSGVRFFEDNHALAQTIGTSGKKGEAYFFGEDAVVEGAAIDLELREKIAADFGRDKAIAWYYLGGWQIVWDTANAGEARIVHVTST